jgi:acetyl esterase/lipase
MTRYAACAILMALPFALPAAEPEAAKKLWPGKPPGETKDIGPEKLTPPKDANDVARLTNVSEPTITVYKAPADKANGAAIIVSPGGAYSILAIEHEGTQTCEWLNSLGVTAILLKYRVPKRAMQMPDNLAAIQDAQRAISLVRANAKDWGIDPKRIGMLGFSAGGNLTAWACLAEKRMYDAVDKADDESCKPDFAALIYPAYLVNEKGELKPEYKVTKDSPPMFFAHANDDPVTPLSSAMLYQALKKNNVPAELHIFATGGHGYGMKKIPHPVASWPDRCADWMKARGYLTKK